MRYNFGKLKEQTIAEKNIIYYRKGRDEISINLTNKCPNSCCFCIRDRDVGWGVSNLYLTEDPTLEEIKKEIERILKNNNEIKVKKFKICGYGEPIIRVDILPELVSFIKEKCPDSIIQLATSGWPIYYVDKGIDYFKKSVENGLNKVYLGLHSTNYKAYERIVSPSIDPRKAFNQVIEFINLSKTLGLNLTCAFVDIGKIQISEIDKFAKKLKCEYEVRKFEK
jgi:TatD family-associated radical SAM protein